MPKAFTPKIVTANDLLKGDVIYQTLDGWSRDLADAEVLTDEAHADLRLIEGSQQANSVVGVYLADTQVIDGLPTTTHFRESFRAKGPSNYNHGKQEVA
ncbi:hypothetical protein ASD8599_01702 [Ascidiaceihabitans donghaensis]|uniref:Uncharacterized protein n=1 Tax=Ascidiaceihabitans donghaensis TaxID=1510460 RepID=A0A2R8BD67_9RHOB|nr:DUF2849 domain-containing protein [Ascidiaceihabitans donghaensis]SPH20961.1 hypothetical protein ASD8599_01702 [Ascidiaceihabitans donghaensis]